MTTTPSRPAPQVATPWRVCVNGDYPAIELATIYGVPVQSTEDGQGQKFVHISANVGGSYRDWRALSDTERLEAAHLMAAAPILYDALLEILEYEGGADHALDDPYVMDRARSALAIAQGAAPAGGEGAK